MKRMAEAVLKHAKRMRQAAMERKRLYAKLQQVVVERDRLQAELARTQLGWPPGHFYSPIPNLEDVRQRDQALFLVPERLPSIDLHTDEQIALLSQFAPYYASRPSWSQASSSLRYASDNPNYSLGEATILYCMMRHVAPKRVIEVGSGYSSCVILDVNELYFDNKIDCTFIEPYPQLLQSLIFDRDATRIEIMQQAVQDVDTQRFTRLSAGDILFIDSTHVAKIGSDVNDIFFRILTSLAHGVHIHFHDVYYPFEYPKQWIYEGRSWNEAYMLRAFLQYNNGFHIKLFNSYLSHLYQEKRLPDLPAFVAGLGSSIWIEKQ